MPISIFARIGSIQGESQDARHRDEIEVLSWSWGLSQPAGTGSGPGGGGGGGVGRVSVRDLHFTHHVDKASPVLMTACAKGQHTARAVLSVRRAGAGQEDHLVITLTDVLVTAVSTSVDAEAGSTVEDVVLSFAKVDLEYRAQKPNGTLDSGVHFTHDLETGTVG